MGVILLTPISASAQTPSEVAQFVLDMFPTTPLPESMEIRYFNTEEEWEEIITYLQETANMPRDWEPEYLLAFTNNADILQRNIIIYLGPQPLARTDITMIHELMHYIKHLSTVPPGVINAEQSVLYDSALVACSPMYALWKTHFEEGSQPGFRCNRDGTFEYYLGS